MATSNFSKNPLVGSEADELLLLLQYLKLTARSSTPAVDKLPSVKFPQWSEKADFLFVAKTLDIIVRTDRSGYRTKFFCQIYKKLYGS